MKTVELFVPGKSHGKGRPRFRVVTPRGKRPFVQTYTPPETEAYERRVAEFAMVAAAKQRVALPFEGAVELEVVAVFKRPQRLMRKRDPFERIEAPTKPDFDNIEKSIADGLQKAGLFDDKAVCRSSCVKLYQRKENDPVGVFVRVKPYRYTPPPPPPLTLVGADTGEE